MQGFFCKMMDYVNSGWRRMMAFYRAIVKLSNQQAFLISQTETVVLEELYNSQTTQTNRETTDFKCS